MGNKLTHLSTFSGIGGLDLAAEWAGFETVGQCEWADYPTKILEKHWPDVPRWRDIRTLTKESFYEKTGLRTVDFISGGFPCQPFSVAGKQRGKEDDRYLWPELLRVISEIRPRWVVGENVAGIVNLALDTVLSDLEGLGYSCEAVVIPACAVDAPHRRDRVAIVAYCDNGQRNGKNEKIQKRRHTIDGGSENVAYANRERFEQQLLFAESSKPERQSRKDISTRGSGGREGASGRSTESGLYRMDDGLRTDVHDKAVADTQGIYGKQLCEHPVLDKREREREKTTVPQSGRLNRADTVGEDWPDEPRVGRVAHGIPDRVDRLKCLGNAVVPQQFYPIFQAIADIEKGLTDEDSIFSV